MNFARALFLVGVGLGRLGSAAPSASLPDLRLEATDGRSYELKSAVREARLTVFVFFSQSCPCMTAHDARLIALAKDLQPKGVQVLLVDPEVGDALERGRAEVQRRGYPFPILADPKGRLAQAFGAQFATTSVIVDAEGVVRYRGGIDAAKREPTAKGRFFLEEALLTLLGGKSPDPAETKSFGCFLRIS